MGGRTAVQDHFDSKEIFQHLPHKTVKKKKKKKISEIFIIPSLCKFMQDSLLIVLMINGLCVLEKICENFYLNAVTSMEEDRRGMKLATFSKRNHSY